MNDHQNGLHLEAENWPCALFTVALVLPVFQVITAAFSLIPTQVLRAMHVRSLLLVVYISYPTFGIRRPWQLLTQLLGITDLGAAVYQWIFGAGLVQRSGELTQADMVAGAVLIVLTFEAARWVMGITLPIIRALSLIYSLFGERLPSDLVHRGYGFSQIANQLLLGTEGLYGTPTYVSATYIYLFILLGVFLEQADMIRPFTDFTMGLFGHRVGGPAKVSIFSSALMGTITDSGAANVVTTGQFTIPSMRRFSYKPAFVGGAEATASMGNQLTPLVMRVMAFIVAETINVPYVEIAKAALTPALLYFGSMYWMIHLGIHRADPKDLSHKQCPSAWGIVRERWSLLIPLLVLITLLFSGRTPPSPGTTGLALTAIVILDSAIILRVSPFGLCTAFWMTLGLLCARLSRLGIGMIFVMIAALTLACWSVRDDRETLRTCVRALTEDAWHAISVDIVCILVGIIIRVIPLTGITTTFASYVLDPGRESLLLSLVLTMVICLVLGMGIPTIPNYIITSSIAVPALLELGAPLIASHMFVFCFGILVDLTPPVALACFATAPVVKGRGLKVNSWAVYTALAGFVVSFIAVYLPALMLREGSWEVTLYVVCKAVLAIGLWGMASIGYLQRPLTWQEHLVASAARASLVLTLLVSDGLGFVLGALVIGWRLWRQRAREAVA